MRKTEISENPAFTFRTFLLRLGLIGPEYKNVREHLLSNLPGDRAWRYDKAQYPSLQNRQNRGREEMSKSKEKLYFAYGSNMNLNQMAFRCPDAEVVESVRVEGYRLAFRTNGGGNGVATILPEEGSYVDGVLWRISERDEQHLDHYEGFPFLYGKEPVTVTDQDGVRREIMAYTMNSPYKDKPAMRSVS